MSSDDSGSSLSPSTPHGSRSGMVSSVHIPRQTTPRNSHSTRHKARREAVKSGRSQTGSHARLLTEGDEQLDYNEELPSLKRDLPTNPKSRPHEPHSSSPREEGEEDSDYEDEEDEGDINSSGYEAKRSHHIPVVYRDREEGEASSDDDHRKRVIPIKPNSGRSDLLTSGLSLDEAEYRHRLHKRHERRQRERLGVTSDRSRSQLPVDTMDDSRKVTKVSGHLTSSEEEFEGRRKLIRPGPSDIEYRTSTKEASYDPDASYGKRLSSRKHEPMLVDSKESINPEQQPIHRSQSAANINYDSPSQIRQHRTKSKKSKYDKPGDEVSKKHGKKSKRTVATTDTVMDYAAWESYVYEKVSSVTTSTNSHVHTEVIRTSPHSTSSSSPSSPIRPATRAIPPKQLDAFTESVHDVRSRHRLERDTRESAPPPEPGRSKVLVDTESRKKLKSDKHKSRHRMGGSKRRHRSKERRQPSPSAEEVPVHRAKRSHSKSRRHSRDRLPSPESSPDAAIKKSRRHPPLIPEAEQREERTAAASSSSSSSSSEPDDTAAVDVALLVDDVKANSEKSDQVQPPKQEIRPSRFQHYRLYSSSSSEEEENNLGEAAAMEDGTGGDLPRQRSTLFDITTPAEVYEQLENRPPRAPSKPYYFPSIQGCRSVEEFECLNRIEEGTYGVVYRARDKKTNEIVALKRLKMEKERDGFPITSLREINTLMKAQHENIVTVREIVVGSNMDKIYLVMDYVEHDLKSLMEIMNGPFSIGEVKCLLMQLLKAVRHLHDNWIIHRDLKTSNLLLSHQGILKVGDFGLAREYGSPLEPYTEVVVTLWYRAPELLLGIKEYSCPIDLWSVGCIFAEFLLQRPLFPGKGEIDQLNMVFCALGTPTEHIWPGVKQLPGMKKSIFAENPHNQLRRRFTEKQISDKGFDLLNSFLTYCPEKRITAEKALNHAYFNERPRAIHPSMFPTWPARSEGAVAARKQASPRPPVGGGALAAAAAAIAAAAEQNSRSRVQPPPPPMGGQRFYSKMGGDSRPGTSIGSGDAVSSVVDKGFLLRF